MFFIVLSAYLYVLFGIPLGLGTMSGSSNVEYCLADSRGFQNISNMYPKCSNDSSVSLIEQIQCQFNWTNQAEMIEKVNDQIKHRHKQFLRFNVPVFYVDRASGSWKEARNEFETWVWVAATHEYMLYFPHNFNVLSLGTMGIITNNFWKPDGEGDIFGSCDAYCVNSKMATHRCALTKNDMLNFMADVAKDKIEWNYVCRQLDYDVTDVIRNRNSAIPDLFYYSRFLWQFFTRRPNFGIAISRDDFIHYNCFEKNGNLEKKELLMNYIVICLLAVILWLYCPLLIYYFPSSKPTFSIFPSGLDPKDFHPTYKSPVYFVNFLRCIFCFYMKENVSVKSRVRRLLFFLCSFVISIRFLYTPYRSLFVVYVSVFLVAVSIPEFWSVYLNDNQPTHFLDLWEYPKGVYRKNTREKEYQFLAHCMKERVFLALDLELWKMLCFESFKSPVLSNAWLQLYADFPISIMKLVLSFFVCVITLVTALLLNLVYHFIPAFYFYKKIFLAIHDATRHSLFRTSPCVNALTSIISFVCSAILVGYFMVIMMFCCYLFAEVTMFTYIGTVLDPSMAFKYVSLVGAISLLLHKFATDLRETYDGLRDEIVDILNASDHRSHLCNNANNDDKVELSGQTVESNGEKVESHGQKVESDSPKVIESDYQIVESDDGLKILLKIDSQEPQVLLYRDHFATYLSRPLLELCIEQCDPIRRQMLFIFVKVLLITFYVSIALWIKNVFHKEKEVSSIFVVARDIAMYFVPNLIQFLSDKRRKGKKDANVFLHRRVHEAITAYIKREQAFASATVRP